MTRIGRLGEEGFIALVARAARSAGPRPLVGIGDDAAVLNLPRGARVLLTTDLLTDGIHFRTKYTPGYLLGRKAMAVNLSDIAAMGGVPHSCVVSLGLPRATTIAYARDLVRGLVDRARSAGVALVGGDTCAARALFVNVALLGLIEPGGEVRRSGARPGDGIYVTGRLGASAAGLDLLRRGARASRRRGAWSRHAARAIRAHLDPSPRLRAGRALALARVPTAMIDLSDGLAQDLPRLCRASRTGAVIEAAAVPVAGAALRVLGKSAALRAALAGGEDYELLFTAGRGNEPLIARLARRIRLPVARIGEILARRRGIALLGRDGRYRPLRAAGFEHFRR